MLTTTLNDDEAGLLADGSALFHQVPIFERLAFGDQAGGNAMLAAGYPQ